MSIIEGFAGHEASGWHGAPEKPVVVNDVSVIAAGRMICIRVFPWLTDGESPIDTVQRHLQDVPEFPRSEQRTMAEIYGLNGDDYGFEQEAVPVPQQYSARKTIDPVEFRAIGPAPQS